MAAYDPTAEQRVLLEHEFSRTGAYWLDPTWKSATIVDSEEGIIPDPRGDED